MNFLDKVCFKWGFKATSQKEREVSFPSLHKWGWGGLGRLCSPSPMEPRRVSYLLSPQSVSQVKTSSLLSVAHSFYRVTGIPGWNNVTLTMSNTNSWPMPALAKRPHGRKRSFALTSVRLTAEYIKRQMHNLKRQSKHQSQKWQGCRNYQAGNLNHPWLVCQGI